MTCRLAVSPQPPAAQADGNPFLQRVAQAYPRLTPAERKVADVLLASPLVFARTPMALIGDQAGASAPSIMRFCRALGYSGLTELKQALVSSLGRHDTAALFHLPPPRQHDAASDVLDAAHATLSHLRGLLDSAAVNDAITLLARAPQVVCVASCQLGLAAQYARDSLLRHGVAAILPAAGRWPELAPDGQAAPAAGLFLCQGMPDAAMLEAIALCQRGGAGAVMISDVPLPAFVPAAARLVLGTAPAAGVLLAYGLMTDILLAGLAGRRAG